MREWVGRVIDGKYRLTRLLGEGGMGVVYEAQHEILLRPVAVKFLWPAYATDAGAVRRFHREAQAAGRIGHDNICEVIDLGSAEGVPYLVMPLLRGPTLADMVEKGGPVAIDRAVDILSQVLDALAAAHDRGIVHRDLKPDNIFLTSIADRQDLVKILDFGVAKILAGGRGGSGSDVRLTGTGTVVGTASYMAPEQARGDRDVDHRIDVHAAGAVLYEMVTGRRMYDGATYNEVLHKIFLGDFQPASDLHPDVPFEIEGVIMRAVARLRDRRYPDARSLRSALWVAHAAIRARTTARSVPVRSFDLPAPPPVRPAPIVPDPIRAAPPPEAGPPAAPADRNAAGEAKAAPATFGEESAAWSEPPAVPEIPVAAPQSAGEESAAWSEPLAERGEEGSPIAAEPGSPVRGPGLDAGPSDKSWSAGATMPIADAVVRFVDGRRGEAGGKGDPKSPEVVHLALDLPQRPGIRLGGHPTEAAERGVRRANRRRSWSSRWRSHGRTTGRPPGSSRRRRTSRRAHRRR